MTHPATTDAPSGAAPASHLRGSSLLLAGRVLALGLNLLTQVLTVRALSRHDYGLFAYAMAGVALLSTLTTLGLDKAVSRVAALYRERQDHARLVGGLALAAGAILLVSSVLALLLFGLRGHWPVWLRAEPEAFDLLAILFVLAPLNALDSVTIAYYSVLADARAIFIRRHLMVPLLRLLAVVAVLLLGGSVHLLAAVYAVVMVAGGILNGFLLGRVLLRGGYLSRWDRRQLVLPYNDLLGFSLSLLSTDLALIMYESFLVFLLGYAHTAADVAAFQAVRPFARLNEVVLFSFTMLFVPTVTRLHERGERASIGAVHGETALWIAMATFPVLALTLGLADPLVALALGSNYADAGRLLAVMSLGYYVSAVTGLNLQTLKALGRIRPLILLDLSCAVGAAALSLLLVPRWGAPGAVVALLLVLVGDGVFSCWVLQRATGIAPLARAHRAAWLAILGGTLLLVGGRLLPGRNVVTDAVVVLAALALVWTAGRRSLRILSIFPELERLPGIRRVVH